MNEKIKFFIEKIKHNILKGRYDITDWCGDCFVDEKEIQSCMKDCGDIPEECYICIEMFGNQYLTPSFWQSQRIMALLVSSPT